MALLETHPQHIRRVLVESRKDLGIHIGDTARRLHQALAFGVLAHRDDDVTHCLANSCFIKARRVILLRLWLRWFLLSERHITTLVIPPHWGAFPVLSLHEVAI